MDEAVKKKILETIKTYNKYRAPEAIAELISIDNNFFKVKFTGSFCRTCGIRDWVEDLAYMLMDQGLDVELVDYIEPENIEEEYRIGVFKVKGSKGDRV